MNDHEVIKEGPSATQVCLILTNGYKHIMETIRRLTVSLVSTPMRATR